MLERKVAKRAIGFYKGDVPGKRVGFTNFNNFETSYVGSSMINDENPLIFINLKRQIYSRGNKNGHKGMRSPIPKSKNGPMRSIVCRARIIDGYLYVCGSGRSVCRRKGVNDQESLYFGLPIPMMRESGNVSLNDAMMFLDVDGFSEEDIYVAGGENSLWHLEGKSWRKIEFPSARPQSICCGGGGYVYIGAQSSSLFRGRDSE